MTPLQLSLRNFLSYRDNQSPLDLRGIHIACLCGANGHGKSALLDAMTWCIWGQARTGSRNHNDLISYGESECRVELEFQAQNRTYRTIRRRRSTGQGRTELDLFLLNDHDQPRPITGNTVTETEAIIRRIVGMDYNTFVNSAFLLQGRSDEFIRKSPNDRKNILSSILGLGLYDTLQTAAREQRNHWQNTAAHSEGALSRTQAALDAIPDSTDDLAQIDQRLLVLDAEIAAASAEATRRRAAVDELHRKQTELETAARHIAALRSDIRQAEAAAVAIRQRIADTHVLAERSDAINAGAQQLAAARQQLDLLESARREYDRLRSRRAELQTAIARERAALSVQTDGLERRIRDELEPQANRTQHIARQLATLTETEQSLTDEQGIIDTQTATAADLQGSIALRKGELARCIADGKELRAKQTEMQSVDALCPLCRTPLSEDACGNIAAWYESEINARLQLHDEIRQTLNALSGQHTQLVEDSSRRRRSLDRRQRQCQQERGRLEQEQRQSDDARQLLATLYPRLNTLQKALETDDFAASERSSLAKTDTDLAALSYDDTIREETYRQTQSLQHWDAEQRDLRAALARLPDDEAELQQNQIRLTRWQDELLTAEAALSVNQAAIADLPVREREAQASAAALADRSRERDDLLARQGRLRGDAERRQQYLAEVASLQRSHANAQVEQSIYSDLYDAFGRNGVPAMLIDAAIPHLENEANHLLGRMTDNRLALKLETQRLNQGGRVTETLDIRISDELGLRSYDLFSGGEAFRINLSLRIALSKVLAQRTGVPLPTLFIDEGFGTQDAAGRERIVDAISSIQDEFEKIIVITHLDELKDLFPARIEVLKTDAGSQFWLS